MIGNKEPDATEHHDDVDESSLLDADELDELDDDLNDTLWSVGYSNGYVDGYKEGSAVSESTELLYYNNAVDDVLEYISTLESIDKNQLSEQIAQLKRL